ncbi:unnamed protein product [Nesidiocoris tenuis]|uniref:Uncharacterized protein n=1 Tax=Nesidiocoris tenuis TaxID=355587 RepID=A0A6H5H3H4_9HEMI|nr:unnamed protein product [Nesidiocoris tenuis]
MAAPEDSTIESVNAGGSGVSSRGDHASDRLMARRGGKVPPNGAVRGRYGRQTQVEPFLRFPQQTNTSTRDYTTCGSQPVTIATAGLKSPGVEDSIVKSSGPAMTAPRRLRIKPLMPP